MSVEHWESREPKRTAKVDPALAEKIEREMFLENLEKFGIGLSVFAAIAGSFLSAYLLSALMGIVAVVWIGRLAIRRLLSKT